MQVKLLLLLDVEGSFYSVDGVQAIGKLINGVKENNPLLMGED